MDFKSLEIELIWVILCSLKTHSVCFEDQDAKNFRLQTPESNIIPNIVLSIMLII